jgi:hypothetical protein
MANVRWRQRARAVLRASDPHRSSAFSESDRAGPPFNLPFNLPSRPRALFFPDSSFILPGG